MFDKKQYWKNRKEGKRGQGEPIKPVILPNPDSNVAIGFDNTGKMVTKNRAYRRQRIKLPNTTEKKISRKNKK